MGGEGHLVTRDGKKITDARTLAGQIGLAKAMRKYDLRRIISFHSRVERAREFAASMPESSPGCRPGSGRRAALWSDVASGEMSAGERHVLLQHLSRLDDGERGLLANARCLSEGVDVPTLDGVAFIDPRRSEVDIVQAVGRAIRKSERQDRRYHRYSGVHRHRRRRRRSALDSSRFKPVWDVIKALRAHDENWASNSTRCAGSWVGPADKPRLPDKIHLDVPPTVGTDFARAFDVRLVDATTAPWEFWYGLLEKYVAEHGTARVAAQFTDRDYRLGSWVAKQRAKGPDWTLNADRARRLAELSGWTWDPREGLWEEGFDNLEKYVKKHGDALVPKIYTIDGYQLGAWVTTQRRAYKQGRLAPERQQWLEGVTGWSWDSVKDRWQEAYRSLQRYVAENGHTRIPALEKYQGFRLGQWVTQQRYHRNRGNLAADRIRLLELFPDWTWDAVTDEWEEGFRHLADYVRQYGDSSVPQSFRCEDGHKLGVWVTSVRSDYRSGDLDDQRQARLEKLPGWSWAPRDTKWEEGFRRLEAYAAAHGDTRMVRTYIDPGDGYKLGMWTHNQRAAFARGRLNAERIARLQKLPGWVWDANEGAWETISAILQSTQLSTATVPQQSRLFTTDRSSGRGSICSGP